jgi:hypothetical protein
LRITLPKHIYTFHKNVPQDGQRAEIGKSHLLRFSTHDQYPYCNLVGILSEFFTKAQLYHEHGLIDQPAHLSIIVNQQVFRRYKSEDGDTQIHRLMWLVDNFADPDCGAIISLYVTDTDYEYEMMDTQWHLNSLWHTKETHTGTSSGYVTLATHSEDQPHHKQVKGKMRNDISKWSKIVKEYAAMYELKVVEVDYTTPINDLYTLLLNARAHYTYMGATAYVAGITRTPTYIIGYDTDDVDIGVRYPHITPNYATTSLAVTPWGTWGSKPGHILQKDANLNKMVLDDQPHMTIAPLNVADGRNIIHRSFRF